MNKNQQNPQNEPVKAPYSNPEKNQEGRVGNNTEKDEPTAGKRPGSMQSDPNRSGSRKQEEESSSNPTSR